MANESLPLSAYDPFPTSDPGPGSSYLPARPEGVELYGPLYVNGRPRFAATDRDDTLTDRLTGRTVVELPGPFPTSPADDRWSCLIDVGAGPSPFTAVYTYGPDGYPAGIGFQGPGPIG